MEHERAVLTGARGGLTHLLHLVATALGSSQLSPAPLVGLDLHREEGAGSSRYRIRGVRTDHHEGEEQAAAWTRERRRGAEPGNRRRIGGGRRRLAEPSCRWRRRPEQRGAKLVRVEGGEGKGTVLLVRGKWGREGEP
jgi:hypothetical protein